MVESHSKIILVTGGTGFIGSQILNHLLNDERANDYTIRCAVRDPENAEKIKPLEAFFHPDKF